MQHEGYFIWKFWNGFTCKRISFLMKKFPSWLYNKDILSIFSKLFSFLSLVWSLSMLKKDISFIFLLLMILFSFTSLFLFPALFSPFSWLKAFFYWNVSLNFKFGKLRLTPPKFKSETISNKNKMYSSSVIFVFNFWHQ